MKGKEKIDMATFFGTAKRPAASPVQPASYELRNTTILTTPLVVV